MSSRHVFTCVASRKTLMSPCREIAGIVAGRVKLFGQTSVEGGANLLKCSERRVVTDEFGCTVIHRPMEHCQMQSL